MDGGTWLGYSPWGHKESDTTERLHFVHSLHLGHSIVLYFCWSVLILLIGVYVYITHIFYCCYKPLPLNWVFAVLWSFPFFSRSIYCTLFSLDCFDFAYGYICIYLYSVKLFIVINLCIYIGLL